MQTTRMESGKEWTFIATFTDGTFNTVKDRVKQRLDKDFTFETIKGDLLSIFTKLTVNFATTADTEYLMQTTRTESGKEWTYIATFANSSFTIVRDRVKQRLDKDLTFETITGDWLSVFTNLTDNFQI